MKTETSPGPGMTLVWIALGAVPGSLLRWSLANTLVANTLGCFVVGASGLMGSASTRRRLLIGIGFAGSLTTFSTWILELLSLLQVGHWATLFSQVLRDGSLGISALLLGTVLHRWLVRLREQSPRR